MTCFFQHSDHKYSRSTYDHPIGFNPDNTLMVNDLERILGSRTNPLFHAVYASLGLTGHYMQDIVKTLAQALESEDECILSVPVQEKDSAPAPSTSIPEPLDNKELHAMRRKMADKEAERIRKFWSMKTNVECCTRSTFGRIQHRIWVRKIRLKDHISSLCLTNFDEDGTKRCTGRAVRSLHRAFDIISDVHERICRTCISVYLACPSCGEVHLQKPERTVCRHRWPKKSSKLFVPLPENYVATIPIIGW